MLCVLNFYFLFLSFVADFDRDGLFADLHIAPLAVIVILARVVRIKFFFKNVRSVRSARGHGHGTIAAVAQARKGRA